MSANRHHRRPKSCDQRPGGVRGARKWQEPNKVDDTGHYRIRSNLARSDQGDRARTRASARRYKVFEAVYSGGGKPKDAAALRKKTGLTEIAVLQLATPMAHKQFFEQVKHHGRVAFKKYPHINAVKQTILRAANKPAKTRTASSTAPETVNDVGAPRRLPRIQQRSAWKSSASKRPRPTHDVFVCHASEDKGFVGPLVTALKRARVKVWYDKDFLLWGDGLRSSIDRGLANFDTES